jgi:DnaJ family protein C protein 9
MPRKQKKDEDYEPDEPAEHNQEEEMDDEPPSIDPYAVLELETSASADDVKKAYRKLALKHHPGALSFWIFSFTPSCLY